MKLSGLKGATLPRYHNGPIVEVAASVQFEAIKSLDAAHLGYLWGMFRDEYPKTEQHQALATRKEQFGPPKAGAFQVSIGPSTATRVWFVKGDDTELIQIQNNMLVFNWRKRKDNAYVGFELIRKSLRHACDTLAKFITAEGLGELRINQCELTYVNHLGFTDRLTTRQPLVEIFSCWREPEGLPSLESPEEVNLQLQHVLTESDRPVGRLFVDLKSAYGGNGQMMALYALNMIARGKPADSSLPGAMTFLDRAHECLVQYFTDITTPAIHLQWERN